MDDIQKLGILLPHWMEHNQEHATEFKSWADRAENAGKVVAAERIRFAVEAMAQANDALKAAQLDLGGVGHSDHDHHHHHHHDDHPHSH